MRINPSISFLGAFVLALAAPRLHAATRTIAAPRLILSEAMADPTALSDAHGEFLELANAGGDSLRLDSLTLGVDGASLVLTALAMAPGGLFLICRDSIPAENGGMICGRQWAGLSLANGRALEVTLKAGAGETVEYPVPASRPGISWENTLEAGADFKRFLGSVGPWLNGDSATPGARNSRSTERPRSDLGITQVTLRADGMLSVGVENRGSGPPPRSFLSVRADQDWDGEAETFLDSLEATLPASGARTFLVPVGRGLRGLVQVRLTYDEDAADNLFLMPVEPEKPMVLSEWCPAPEAGAPEWVELRNGTADSGGQGRTLSLTRMEFDGRLLGAAAGEIAPGEYVVLTESTSGFRARYGALKVRLIEIPSWPGLRNTGDTLRLSAAGFALDSVVYGAKALADGGGCLVRGRPGEAGPALPEAARSGSGTPGFSVEPVTDFSWELSGRIAGSGRSVDAEVRAPSGFRYSLRIFDLEGNCVRDLGGGGPGRNIHRWTGESDRGGRLQPGPYVICLAAEGHRSRKQVVVVAEGP